MSGFLDRAYDHKSGDEARRLYDEWAATYDTELKGEGYITPFRCAEALAELVGDFRAPVLDVGCGTGLSGQALQAAGFTTVDGVDPSSKMLSLAKAKDVYRTLAVIDAAAPLTAPAADYHNAMASGVLSPGLAPPEALDQIFSLLPQGGRLTFSLNDKAVADGAHEGRLREIVDAGLAAVEFKEYGEHIPGREMRSWVYVLVKL